MKNGFTGGLIVDFPNSKKARKYFLFLMAGYSEQIIREAEEAVYLPKARSEGEDYNFADTSDSEMEADDDEEEDKEDLDSDDSDAAAGEEGNSFKKKDEQIKSVGRRRVSKTIQKAKK